MVEYGIAGALIAGLAGVAAMTLLMQMSAALGMTRMPSMALIQGLMVTGNASKAKLIGFVTHVIVMGTVVFGPAYAAVFVRLDDAGLVTGAIVGAVHGIVAGVAMVMFGPMHPRMDAPSAIGAGRGGQVEFERDGEVRLFAPGLFAKNYGAMTPVGLVIGHVVYGLVVAAVYGAIV